MFDGRPGGLFDSEWRPMEVQTPAQAALLNILTVIFMVTVQLVGTRQIAVSLNFVGQSKGKLCFCLM